MNGWMDEFATLFFCGYLFRFFENTFLFQKGLEKKNYCGELKDIISLNFLRVSYQLSKLLAL
jgi:hypothetical protein